MWWALRGPVLAHPVKAFSDSAPLGIAKTSSKRWTAFSKT